MALVIFTTRLDQVASLCINFYFSSIEGSKSLNKGLNSINFILVYLPIVQL